MALFTTVHYLQNVNPLVIPGGMHPQAAFRTYRACNDKTIGFLGISTSKEGTIVCLLCKYKAFVGNLSRCFWLCHSDEGIQDLSKAPDLQLALGMNRTPHGQSGTD